MGANVAHAFIRTDIRSMCNVSVPNILSSSDLKAASNKSCISSVQVKKDVRQVIRK